MNLKHKEKCSPKKGNPFFSSVYISSLKPPSCSRNDPATDCSKCKALKASDHFTTVKKNSHDFQTLITCCSLISSEAITHNWQATSYNLKAKVSSVIGRVLHSTLSVTADLENFLQGCEFGIRHLIRKTSEYSNLKNRSNGYCTLDLEKQFISSCQRRMKTRTRSYFWAFDFKTTVLNIKADLYSF